MNLSFFKYHGAGNDFIVIDNRKNAYSFLQQSPKIINKLCNRHFGIGADGLMLLNGSTDAHFSMKYFNADGLEGTMCGNGGRCIALFAYHLNIVNDEITFKAIDGLHKAIIINNELEKEVIKLKMTDVNFVQKEENFFVMDTGSPHYVEFVDDLDNFDVFGEGKKIRSNKKFGENGVNVNFVKEKSGTVFVRTYERGVENETLACGTGATAVAIAFAVKNKISGLTTVPVDTLGGSLSVTLERMSDDIFKNIWLQGPARKVFEGNIKV